MKILKTLVNRLKQKIYPKLKNPKGEIPKIFFCHVPKCAGTSISTEIQKKIYSKYNIGTFRIVPEASFNSATLLSIDMMKVRKIILAYNLSDPYNYFGTGHVYCTPNILNSFSNEWNFITILRNPIDRWISEYVYNTYKTDKWAKNTLPLNDYLNSKTGKLTGISYVKYFSSIPDNYNGKMDEFIEEAIENLNHFYIIGILEKLDKFTKTFKLKFNSEIVLPKINPSPNTQIFAKIKSNEILLEKINNLCKADMEIYQKIVKLSEF